MSGVHFEGPEKKLELVVRGGPSLRSLPEHTWHGVVQAAGACALSRLRGDGVDAYLLSESSLFVWDDRVTMLTCGRTHLVDAVFAMLEFVPRESVALLVYERKNEHFPERQPSTFVDDARRLSALLPGKALRLGAEHEHRIMLYGTSAPFTPQADDVTLEILMHGIDPRWIDAHLADGALGDDLIQRAATLLPEFRIDSHVFEPAGFSLNALRDDRYYTIHVTPQRVGSYASFETNAEFRSQFEPLVSRVVALFAPEAFDVVTFMPAPAGPLHLAPEGASLRKHVRQSLAGYDVSFRHYFFPDASPTSGQPVNLS